MMKDNKLLSLVQSFFQEYLLIHRGLSQNTIVTYRDALKLFFAFESTRQNKAISKFTLDDINVEAILIFLSELENTRQNSAITRNLRLAALKTFCNYLITKDTLRAGEYQKIIALPQKRVHRKVIDYLDVHEVKLILNNIDRSSAGGQRDYVLLNLLYNTGARVQEICDLRVSSIIFGHIPMATIVGKGNKTRHVPLWPETAKLLQNYLSATNLLKQPEAYLFSNMRDQPLGRFGVRYIVKQHCMAVEKICPSLKNKQIGPHTFRHTIAMHLLQAGIDLTVIKSWLGHVNLETTNAYVEIDLEMKRKALATCLPVNETSSLKKLLDKNKNLLTWLESL